MKKQWTTGIFLAALSVSVLSVNILNGNASEAYTAAPDGKTDAALMAQDMGISPLWNRWKSDWEQIKSDWTQISLTPGSNESELNFAWYSKKTDKAKAPKLMIGEGRNMRNAKTYEAVQTAVKDEADPDGNTYFSNKVTASGLKEGTTYYYSYEKEDGSFTKPVSYKTKSTEEFRFIFVGDPQIGSSNELKGSDSEEFYNAQSDSVCNDAFNWNATLNAAMEMSGNQAGFVVSAGDQIQTTKKKAPNKNAANSEIEYAGYLSPEILKSLPVATTVGNHDADNENYSYHFNTPNNSELGSNGIVGGDYYFTYGSALFMMLNTQDTNVAEHEQFLREAISKNPNCTWRIVTLHQDIYGSAEHSNEPEITNLRYQLVPYLEENDIDLVLTGHDHAYSRSQMLLGGTKEQDYSEEAFEEQLEKDRNTCGDETTARYTAPGTIPDTTADTSEQAYLSYLNSVMDKTAVEQTDGSSVTNPEGILYMTASSSSGSKYYDLVPRMQTYIANRWQEDVPTYSIIDVSDTSLSINTYRTDNNEKIDKTFTISKIDKADISGAKITGVKNKKYTGKKITLDLKVTMGSDTLKKGTDYTVNYSNNKKVGKATVTITGKNHYTGAKKVSFRITKK